WEYDPTNNRWSEKNLPPFQIPRRNTAITTVGYKAYLACGVGCGDTSHFWTYDPLEDVWTNLKPFPALNRDGAFAINSQGFIYIGGGSIGGMQLTDMYAYSLRDSSWTTLAEWRCPNLFLPSYASY